MKRRSVNRRLAAAGVILLAVPTFSSCASQEEKVSGNGTQVVEADARIENAQVVLGDPESGTAAFLGTVINTRTSGDGQQADDELKSITADGVRAQITGAPVTMKPGDAVPIQTGRDVSASFEGFDAKAGTYVDVTVEYETAGQMQFQSLVVAPYGYYVEAAPEGTEQLDRSAQEPETETESSEDPHEPATG